MPTVQFGPWRPDASALDVPVTVNVNNVVPATNGFAPVGGLASGSQPLPADPIGAATALAQDGSGAAFAGTQTGLFLLGTGGIWGDVSRTTGGAYATGLGERWRFIQFTNLDTVGDLIIGVNANDAPQKYNLVTGGNFEALGGTPPPARFLATLNQFVVLANLTGLSPITNRVQWSGVQNPEVWDGTQLSGFQDITPGGPVTGLTSGEIVHVFQRNRITRMLFVPDSAEIMQFDEVETGRGLEADNSLVQVGNLAFYYGQSGFFAFDTTSSRSVPIGNQKVDEFFGTDQRSDTRLSMFAGADPLGKRAFWAYISADNSTNVPDRVLIYDWGRQEWGKASIDILALAPFISQGFDLDAMDPFGDLDNLPFGLDSPFWAGGKTLLGIFGPDRRLSNLTGLPLGVTIDTRETTAGNANERLYVSNVAPLIDTTQATIRVGHRERLGDPLTFTDAVAMESTGFCPVHVEGRFVRARLETPAGVQWNLAEGVDPVVQPAGEI